MDYLGEGRAQAVDVVVSVAVIAKHHLIIITCDKRFNVMKYKE